MEGRDRVLDAARTTALVLVMLGHSLAWHVVDGAPGNLLQVRPDLGWLTWCVQILALFFAAGAVGNAASIARSDDPNRWLGRRLRRLLGPVLIYATLWSVLLLPLSVAFGQPVTFAGRFLAQLLWFAGVYLAVVAAVPWTVRHQRPVFLLAWFALIVAVDVVRLTAFPAAGWLNLLLVWGWLHQVGYLLPALRRCAAPALLAAAAAAMAAALGLALLGPYSDSMVSVAGDPEPSNLAPPTVVVALHGLALILGLAAAWGPLERLLRSDALYTPVAILGSRGMGLYLWHIPIVGAIAALCWARGINPDPLSTAWWALHLTAAAAVIGGAWLLAGMAGRALPTLDGVPARVGAAHTAALMTTAGAVVLMLSVTGFATWWSTAFLGVPAGTALLLGLLWAAWRLRPAVSPARPVAASPPVQVS